MLVLPLLIYNSSFIIHLSYVLPPWTWELQWTHSCHSFSSHIHYSFLWGGRRRLNRWTFLFTTLFNIPFGISHALLFAPFHYLFFCPHSISRVNAFKYQLSAFHCWLHNFGSLMPQFFLHLQNITTSSLHKYCMKKFIKFPIFAWTHSAFLAILFLKILFLETTHFIPREVLHLILIYGAAKYYVLSYVYFRHFLSTFLLCEWAYLHTLNVCKMPLCVHQWRWSIRIRSFLNAFWLISDLAAALFFESRLVYLISSLNQLFLIRSLLPVLIEMFAFLTLDFGFWPLQNGTPCSFPLISFVF